MREGLPSSLAYLSEGSSIKMLRGRRMVGSLCERVLMYMYVVLEAHGYDERGGGTGRVFIHPGRIYLSHPPNSLQPKMLSSLQPPFRNASNASPSRAAVSRVSEEIRN